LAISCLPGYITLFFLYGNYYVSNFTAVDGLEVTDWERFVVVLNFDWMHLYKNHLNFLKVRSSCYNFTAVDAPRPNWERLRRQQRTWKKNFFEAVETLRQMETLSSCWIFDQCTWKKSHFSTARLSSSHFEVVDALRQTQI
jgi:hypothetical protein